MKNIIQKALVVLTLSIIFAGCQPDINIVGNPDQKVSFGRVIDGETVDFVSITVKKDQILNDLVMTLNVVLAEGEDGNSFEWGAISSDQYLLPNENIQVTLIDGGDGTELVRKVTVIPSSDTEGQTLITAVVANVDEFGVKIVYSGHIAFLVYGAQEE